MALLERIPAAQHHERPTQDNASHVEKQARTEQGKRLRFQCNENRIEYQDVFMNKSLENL
jgi:hypothetical protein